MRGRDADGRVQTMEFTDLTRAEALRRAAVRGLRVDAVDALGAPAPARVRAPFPLVLFSQELLALLNAGLNLTEALSALHAKETQAGAALVLSQILQSLREGRHFSDVLGALPRHFPDVYVATVRASERTGDLRQALGRYIAYQGQFDTIRKKLISTAIYPVMLLIVGAGVSLFLLGYVVPRFSIVYAASGRDMPWLSALLLTFGQLIYTHWPLALTALTTTCAALAWGLSRPAGRAALLEWLLRLPWLAARANQFRLARFYRAVSLLLAAGIALPRAMGMVVGLLSPAYQVRLARCRLDIERGQSLSSALVAAGLASAIAESLIKVGERSGQLGEMLERAASFADEELARWLDWASRLLEPILMLIIGLVIGTIVVLMYMPIFELAGSFQ